MSTTDTLRIRWRVTDLMHDGCGWSENAASVSQGTIEVPARLSDAAISRRVKAAAGVGGMRRDEWCNSDFGPWRSGCIGCYADIID